jgi:DNA invertase Pin-like site-specific DNA recombinase
MERTIRAAIYVRVSTTSRSQRGESSGFDQNPEVQEQPLRDLITRRGWELAGAYSDRASGAKERRPGLDALMADARRGQFDVVVVWRFDRFARSVRQLVLALEEFRSLRIDFVSHQEALDTSTPMGKTVFTITAAMAELERSIIRERVAAGVEYARRNGTRSGKPIGRPRALFRADLVADLRKSGLSWRQIARKLGAGASTVRREYRAQARSIPNGRQIGHGPQTVSQGLNSSSQE